MTLKHRTQTLRPNDPSKDISSNAWNEDHSIENGIDLPNETPPPPEDNHVRLHGARFGGRMLPAFTGPSGLSSPLQSFLAQNKISWFNPPGNSTTVQVMGMAPPTATGTATAANVTATNIHTSMRRLEYAATTANASSVAGARNTTLQNYIGSDLVPYGGFTFVIRFGPSRGSASNNTRRFFAGMTTNTSAPTDADPTAGTTWANMIAVVADSSDTNFHIAHRSGTGAVTKIDTGIPKAYPDNSQMFELVLFAVPRAEPQVGYRFTRLSDGELFSGTITTNLPAPAQIMTWQCWTSVGGTSSVVGVSIASVYIETDY